MRSERLMILTLAAAAVSPYLLQAARAEPRVIRVTDTVFVKSETPINYDEVAQRVALRLAPGRNVPMVVEGDLIVKGRLGVGGIPEPGTDYGITIRGPQSASLRFISNESLVDPQRTNDQHRHVGTLSVGLDGGLRMEQNASCYTDSRGCLTEDRSRRRAYSGYDSLGDMSFFLSEVDSLTGEITAPRSQSLVFRLIDWDRNIHIAAHRPGQRFYINGSTTLNAVDLQWEVPLR